MGSKGIFEIDLLKLSFNYLRWIKAQKIQARSSSNIHRNNLYKDHRSFLSRVSHHLAGIAD